jgi:hypothetical protein
MNESMTHDGLKTNKTEFSSRKAIFEGIVGAAMLVLAFAAIASSDVSAVGTHLYWSALVVCFALVTFAIDRLHPRKGSSLAKVALPILLHWLGVFLAIELVYFFVGTGRMANLDTGLTNALILALGTYLAGVHSNWRLMLVGLAIGLAAAGTAFLEEYLWVMLGLAVLVIVVLVLGSRRPSSATPAMADDF